MAKLRTRPFDWPFRRDSTTNKGTSSNKLTHAEDKAMEALELLANALPPTTTMGRLVGCPVGDAGAYYICVKEKPLTVAWIPFCGAYRAPAAWILSLIHI